MLGGGGDGGGRGVRAEGACLGLAADDWEDSFAADEYAPARCLDIGREVVLARREDGAEARRL